MIEQPCHQKSGRRSVVRALHDSRIHESLLHYRKMHGISEAVRSYDLTSLCLACKHKIGEHRSAVEQHGVASAEAFRVIAVTDGKIAVHQKHLAESLCRVDIE